MTMLIGLNKPRKFRANHGLFGNNARCHGNMLISAFEYGPGKIAINTPIGSFSDPEGCSNRSYRNDWLRSSLWIEASVTVDCIRPDGHLDKVQIHLDIADAEPAMHLRRLLHGA